MCVMFTDRWRGKASGQQIAVERVFCDGIAYALFAVVSLYFQSMVLKALIIPKSCQIVLPNAGNVDNEELVNL